MKKLFSAVITKTGRRRNNQDNFMLGGKCAELVHDAFAYMCEGKTNSPFFAAVCDGMGGEAYGERASYEACVELAGVLDKLTKDFDANKKLICESIIRANERLCDVMRKEETGRMGSTVSSVLIQGDTLFYTNLGDSRIYLLRDGTLTQITKDHTEGQSMVDAGVLTAEQLKTHPSRNKLNRHLGIFPEEMVLECPIYDDIPLQAGDKLLLCSDGVFGVLDNEAMASILSERTSAEERALKLVDAAYAGGSKDNMTAMVIDIEKTVAAYVPIIYGVGAVCLASLIFFAVNLLADPTLGKTISTPEPTNEVTVAPTETITEIPIEENTPASTATDTATPTDTPEPAQSATEPATTEASITTPVPTPAPTPALTPASTPAPTPAATLTPTVVPSATPISAPTAVPTTDPTAMPEPTETPIEIPTSMEPGNPNIG